MTRLVAGEYKGINDVILAHEGVIDYSEDFTKALKQSDNTDVFGEILNQEQAILQFAESLSLDVRGRLNLGEAGVGKTTSHEALIGALRKLERGEEISGPYAPHVKHFFDKLMQRPRGDIISLWNPVDYYSPYIFTLPVGKEISHYVQLKEESDGFYEGMITLVRDILYGALRHERILVAAAETYREVLAKKDRVEGLSWRLTKKNRLKAIIPEDESDVDLFRTELHKTIRELGESYNTGEVERDLDTILREGPEILINQGDTVAATMRAAHEQVKTSISGYVNEVLPVMRARWESISPEVAEYITSVQNYILDKKNLKALVDNAWLHMKETFNEKIADEEPILKSDFGDKVLKFPIANQKIKLEELLEPNLIFSERDRKQLVVRSPTHYQPLELLGTFSESGSEGEPIHKQIKLGEIAYADLVVLDDGLTGIVVEEDFRRALLTYLGTGRINVLTEGREIKTQSNCHIFANDTDYPFYRQIFDGTEPVFDPALERRFAITYWPGESVNNTIARKSFPHILVSTTKKIQEDMGTQIAWNPKTINLLYHYFLGLTGKGELFPMNIGSYQQLLQQILARTRAEGSSQVLEKHVKEYFQSQIDRTTEYTIAREAALLFSTSTDWMEVGQAHGLYFVSDSDNIGGAFRVNTTLTNRFGTVRATVGETEQKDFMFKQGILHATGFIGKYFPNRLEILLTEAQWEEGAGPSSSAVNLYSMMSALGNIPLKQNVYMTGTVQQLTEAVGIIGGEYAKTRGALLTHREYLKLREKEVDDTTKKPLVVMVPERNVRGLMRSIQRDEELYDALDSGELSIRSHSNIWEGFSFLSDLPREKYEEQIRSNIAYVERELAVYENRLDSPTFMDKMRSRLSN